jgi:prepilin-type N-terminal cleavage/methylation domain-containing protein
MKKNLSVRTFRGLNSAGFTLAEMMTAISILGILVAIGMPAFTRTLPSLRLSDAARQVATELQHVRMKAIAQGIAQQITFSSSSYVLQQCNGTCTDDSGSIALPEGITVTASGAPQFQPPGTVAAATTITLSNGTEQRFVCVKTVGRVNIQNATCS